MGNIEVLADYRLQKANLEKLANQARKAAQSRLNEVLIEAAGIVATFKQDFNANPEFPAVVKTFAINTNGNGNGNGKKPAETPAVTEDKLNGNGPKIGGLKRSLNAAIKNGEVGKVVQIKKQLADLGVTVDENGVVAPVKTVETDEVEPTPEPAEETPAEEDEELFPVE